MAKPFVPNLRLVNLAMLKTFSGIFKHFSVTTVAEVPWIGSCALFVKPRLESHFNVLQCPNEKTSASYASFARNLEEFHKIGSVPGHLNVEELNQSLGIEYSLKERKA